MPHRFDVIRYCAMLCSFQLMHFAFFWNAVCRQVASRPLYYSVAYTICNFLICQKV
jgi:hypothetical protein